VYLVLVVAVNWSPPGRVFTWYLRLLCIRVIHVVCVLGTCGCCELGVAQCNWYLRLINSQQPQVPSTQTTCMTRIHSNRKYQVHTRPVGLQFTATTSTKYTLDLCDTNSQQPQVPSTLATCATPMQLTLISGAQVACVLGTCGCCVFESYMSSVYLALAVAVNWCRTGRVCTWYLWLL
jgi:hypothetical protein